MHDAAYLHIRSRESRATRIVSLTESSVRVGRGRSCEVRLDDPSLAEVEFLLRRRGQAWHLQPVAPPGRLTLDGRPADVPRPVPMGSTLRLAGRWLTLLPSMGAPEAEPDWPPEAEPEVVIPIDQDEPPTIPEREGQPTAAPPVEESASADRSEATADPLQRQRSELARLETRLRQRERWLKDRLHERQWEARWRAAGASLKNRSRPATPPEPKPSASTATTPPPSTPPTPQPTPDPKARLRPAVTPMKPAVVPDPTLRSPRVGPSQRPPRYDRPTPFEPPSYPAAAPPRGDEPSQEMPLAAGADERRPTFIESTPSGSVSTTVEPPIAEAPPAEVAPPASRAMRVTEEVVSFDDLLRSTRVEPIEPQGEAEAKAVSVAGPCLVAHAFEIDEEAIAPAIEPEPAGDSGPGALAEAPIRELPGTIEGPCDHAEVPTAVVPETDLAVDRDASDPEAAGQAEPSGSPIPIQAEHLAVAPPSEGPEEPDQANAGSAPVITLEAAPESPGEHAVECIEDEEEGPAAPLSLAQVPPGPAMEPTLPVPGQPSPAPTADPEGSGDSVMAGAAEETSASSAVVAGPRSRINLPTIGLNDLVSFLSRKGRQAEQDAPAEEASSPESAIVTTGEEEPSPLDDTLEEIEAPASLVEESRPSAVPEPAPGAEQVPVVAVDGAESVEDTRIDDPVEPSEAGVSEDDPGQDLEPRVALSGDWPSAKAILGAQPERERSARPNRVRKATSLAVPSDRIAPDGWTVPGGAWLCVPLMFVVLASGVVGVRLAWTWAEIDRDAGRLADQLAEGRRPEGAMLELWLEREQEIPAAHWSNSTADQMIMRAALLSGPAGGYDPSAQQRAGDLLHALSAGAPGHPSLRFARAWRAIQEPGNDPPASILGLSRDVWPLTWTGRALLAEGKLEEARRAYRSALEIACRSRTDPSVMPGFHEDRRGGRFGLPLEDLIGVVVLDMAGRPEWGAEDWLDVLPDFAGAWLVAARLLRRQGDPAAAEQALDRAVALGDQPAPAGCSPALHEGASAEALALLGRFEEASGRYRSAVERLSAAEEVARRPWMFNLAMIHGQLGETRDERSCLLASMTTDPNDPVTSEAIKTQQGRGMSLIGADGDESDGPDLSVSSRPARTRTLGE